LSEKIILASASPRRKQLLSKLGLEFDVRPSNIEEDVEIETDFGTFVKMLAYKKAKDVAKQYCCGIILGADTIVVVDGEILGKPQNGDDAKKMLEKLNGKWHLVYTGLALIDVKQKKCIKEFEESKVKFRELTMQQIENYIKTGEPFGKAGAYAIQGIGSLLVEKIDGCYYNIVGLPLVKLSKMLSAFGINII